MIQDMYLLNRLHYTNTWRSFFVILATLLTLFLWRSEARAEDQPRSFKDAGVVVIFNDHGFERVALQPLVKLILLNYNERLLFSADQLNKQRVYNSIRAMYDLDPEGQKLLRSQFSDKVISMLEQNDALDIYILGHTNYADHFLLSQIPEKLRRKIRLVYNTGCSDGREKNIKSWIEQKVSAVVAHSEYTWSPLFMYRFLINWNLGYSIADSVSNTNYELALSPFANVVNALDRHANPDGIFDGTMATFLGDTGVTKYTDFRKVLSSKKH